MKRSYYNILFLLIFLLQLSVLFVNLISEGKAGRISILLLHLLLLVTFIFIYFFSRRFINKVKKVKEDSGSIEGEKANITQKYDENKIPAYVLTRSYRKEERALAENEVDKLLNLAISLIRKHYNVYTIAIFFPTCDGGYKIRKYWSEGDLINKEAVIYPGLGVIGCFLKEELDKLYLKEIVTESTTLYYYNEDAGVKSLIAAPLIAQGVKRGIIIVDSTTTANFKDEDCEFLQSIASLIGEAVYNTYMFTEQKLQYMQLSAMSSLEKELFQNHTLASIIEKISEIIISALPCDRLTISIKNDDGTSATIVEAKGMDAEFFKGKIFSLKEKNLASIIYSNNMAVSRNFSEERYEIRYLPDEPKKWELSSFIAVPLGVDECKGMIFVESTLLNAYENQYIGLLSRISTSAGLAIEKMLIFEKANSLAIHDGLTGLYNHRAFQQMLSDEITRAIRYNEPLSLIICDIDFFKKINDTYGHPFGDIVLKGISSFLQSSIRMDIDTVARYGGEEFAIILVKTTGEDAVETAERMRTGISKLSFKTPHGEEVKVTMSFGISEYRRPATSISDFIKYTDKALYKAKENGRNRVETYIIDPQQKKTSSIPVSS
ncbi:MAG: sensor domain-containing diguanylate cyclase [Chitinispirillaceae bacterium]|nr:sensor domain-containing diguanylate cyclase [Chitinispirillaceae bacterium]